MPEVITHPSAQALALFGHGKLSEAQAATVAAHLETCADCRKAVAALPPDSFMGKVRAAKPGGTVLPPGPSPARPASPSVAGRPPASSAPLANVPPELANHPKFRIMRELGRGGMGVIYLAEHRVMEKPVALKVISPAVLDNPQALARFHAEARAAGKLDHQNIARAYDADQAGNLHFLVMEFVEGMSLAQLLEKKGPLPVANACRYVRQAAVGLQHAHEKGMVHRDIKPQNLMLTPQGLVKVLDFGLARLRSERKAAPRVTQMDSFMGTAEYVSPEQASDAREADIRADIYSLGCTLYALLAGQPPFTGTLFNVVMAHIEKEAQPLHELRPDVPPELSAVVAKMLAKDPAQRYQQPIDVAQALVRFVKAGSKPGASSAASVPPGVASAGTGTRIGGDTSRVKGLGQGEAERPAKAPAAGEEKGSPFSDLVDAPSALPAPKKAKKERKEAKPTPARWWKRPGVVAGVIGASLALILMAVVIIKIRVAPSPEGIASPGDTGKPVEETFVILEINQPGAEVSVDGQKITITIPGDNKPVRIKVEPGHRKLRISKDGFEVVTEDVELKAGQKSEPIKVRLERKVAEPPKKPGDVPVKPDAPAAEPQPPKGFAALFNGKDLAGWHGMPHFDPYKLAAMPEADRKSQIDKWTDDAKKHWTVEKGELINDGNGAYLTTDKDYGDVELLIDYKTVPKADSGIYLRATPQVQIWDYTKEGGKWDLGADKGSGGLWNNSPGAPGKDPLVLADKPFGQWNHFRILMVGERVTVYLNDKLVVDHARLENFWDKTKALPKAGQIQLQTNTGEIRWRNVFIREIPSAELPKDPAPPADAFFNGKDLTGWDGLPGYWRVEGGAIVGACPPGRPAHTFLVSQKPYKDFDLKFQVRRKDGVGNSGVQFRSQVKDRGSFTVVGPQCEIDSANFAFPPGSLVTEPNLNPLAVKAPGAAIAKAYKDADFNAFHIRCVGKHVTIKVNGVTAIDDDYPSVPDEGVIAWQIHGKMMPRELTFKDIEFTDLSEGFKPLFNGKDLKGWQVFGGGIGAWKVDRQGILVGSGPTSHLFSPRGDYENFHLIAEAMINDGGNSGQYFRTQFGPGYPKGYEAQINATHGDPIRTGSLYPSFLGLTVEEKREISVYEQLHRPGVWFTQEVIAEGNHIVIKVNGDKTVDFTDRNNTYAKGHFALQQHDPKTLVKFRKIEIKELPAK